jgi:hypothetical protein
MFTIIASVLDVTALIVLQYLQTISVFINIPGNLFQFFELAVLFKDFIPLRRTFTPFPGFSLHTRLLGRA